MTAQTIGARPLSAVIDVGSTSIRMAVAEILPDGGYRTLESLQQSVSLGKDVFMFGRILPSTADECVKALRSFRRVLDEYRVEGGRVRAVATSAVREAANRDAFIDRLYIATGFDVESIDEAEVNRLTYLSVSELIRTKPALKKDLLLIAEVGGGSSEVLELLNGRIRQARSYRLGTLRLREMLEDSHAPELRVREYLRKQIDSSLRQMRNTLPEAKTAQVLLIGGEARFAAAQIHPDWDRTSLISLKVADVSRLTDRLLKMSVDETVARYHFSYPDAETLVPCMVAYVRIARMLKLARVWVGDVSLRDGLLREQASAGRWSEDFANQVIHSARELARKYAYDKRHADHVTELALTLFRAMQDEHRLPGLYELILRVSGILHDIGAYISNRSHHKHSMYLIQHSDLFGLSARFTRMAALIARYHRRAMPKPSHEEFNRQDRADRIAVVKLASILRVADALDRGHTQRVKRVQFEVTPDKLIIVAGRLTDLTLEMQAMEEKGRMFEEVFGKKIVLRAES